MSQRVCETKKITNRIGVLAQFFCLFISLHLKLRGEFTNSDMSVETETWFDWAQAIWTHPHNASMALCAIILGTYWSLSSCLLVVDLLKKWRFQKFQPDKVPNAEMLLDIVGNVLFQQVFLIIPVFYFGSTVITSFFSLSPELPSISRIFVDILCFIIGAEVWFYYTHRLFHHKHLYGRFHKW